MILPYSQTIAELVNFRHPWQLKIGAIFLHRCLIRSYFSGYTTDKLQSTGQSLGRVFNSRRGCVLAIQLRYFEIKLTNLKLKTQPKQLLGSLPLNISETAFKKEIF
jgi:hypothetical protein